MELMRGGRGGVSVGPVFSGIEPASEVDRSGCDQLRDLPAFPGAKTCNAACNPMAAGQR
jgi:hypothetical protein